MHCSFASYASWNQDFSWNQNLFCLRQKFLIPLKQHKSKNDRCRAKRDSIARAPREKRRGEATRVDTAGCMPHFDTHKTQQCFTQNAPHKWIKQLRALACFTMLPCFFTALFSFLVGCCSSQHSDLGKKDGAVGTSTQNPCAVSCVVTFL